MGGIQRIWRIQRMIWVLARHGVLDLLLPYMGRGSVLKWMMQSVITLSGRKALPKAQETHKRAGMRVADALNELGPSFVKLGQALSVRSDLIGAELAADLATLQDRIPPFPTKQAIETIEEEFQASIDDLFVEFEPESIAAASIAQVHFAVIKTDDGTHEKVAVKLLRPNIEQRFQQDLELFEWVAEFLEKHYPKTVRLRPCQVVATLREWVEVELDLRLEGAAAAELKQNFEDEPRFHVPAVYWELTGQRVLTLERIEGFRIDDIEAIKAHGHHPTEILQQATRMFFLQVFRDGFFHADVHPGNMLISPDGTLCPLDFGIMGRLDRETRMFLADTLVGFLTQDYDRVSEAHFRIGFVPNYKSKSQFTQALRAIGAPIIDKPLTDISVATLLQQLFQTTERFDMPLQTSMLLLQKNMLVAEGVGRKLDDGVNMWLLERPLIEEWFQENFSPKAQIEDFAKTSIESLKKLPHTLNRAERLLERIADLDHQKEAGGATYNQTSRMMPKPPDLYPPPKKQGNGSFFNPTSLIILIAAAALLWAWRQGL